MPTDLCNFVPDTIWYDAINELGIPNEGGKQKIYVNKNKKKDGLASCVDNRSYPKLTNLAKLYGNMWRKAQWSKLTKHTSNRNKNIVSSLLKVRKLMPRNLVSENILSCIPHSRAEVYVYEQ